MNRFVFISAIIFLLFAACDDVGKNEQLERGKALFESTSLSANNDIACVSCHPAGHLDRQTHEISLLGRNWKTQTLWNVAFTGPWLWDGSQTNLRELNRVLVNDMMGKNPPITEQELDDLTAYVSSIKSPVSPFLNSDFKLNDLQARGKQIFEDPNRGNCTRCHYGEFFTDNNVWQVKIIRNDSIVNGPRIETTSLSGMWDNQPYWHNAQFETIADLLNGHTWIVGPNFTITPPLTSSEKTALTAYLNTL